VGEAVLKNIVEILRAEMIDLAEEKGSLVDTSVISVSQQLDFYLFQLQTIRKQYNQKAGVNCR
jgi:hypothetical protein